MRQRGREIARSSTRAKQRHKCTMSSLSLSLTHTHTGKAAWGEGRAAARGADAGGAPPPTPPSCHSGPPWPPVHGPPARTWPKPGPPGGDHRRRSGRLDAQAWTRRRHWARRRVCRRPSESESTPPPVARLTGSGPPAGLAVGIPTHQLSRGGGEGGGPQGAAARRPASSSSGAGLRRCRPPLRHTPSGGYGH